MVRPIDDFAFTNVCDMVHFQVSIARIRLEIAKGEVICANCHQRHTTLGGLSATRSAWPEVVTSRLPAHEPRQTGATSGFRARQVLLSRVKAETLSS